MTRKALISVEALAALGAARLAEIIVGEATANAVFRKRVAAALASTKGADAVARLVDRRLAGLERAEAIISWEQERPLAADLGATLDTIVTELGRLSAFHAVDRLLRFVDTQGRVLARVSDSSGRIQGIYDRAAEAMPALAQRLSADDLVWLLGRLLASLRIDGYHTARDIAFGVLPLLPPDLLATWDANLATEKEDFSRIRQAICDARGDVDGYLAFEVQRPEWQRNRLGAAERLLAVGRAREALDWVRRKGNAGLAVMSLSDEADGRVRHPEALERVRLEARILEALKDRPAAQSLRWATFETTLDVGVLREYINKLDDFIEYEEQERAFRFVAASPHAHIALEFFLAWPRLDRAASLVIALRTKWRGQHAEFLADAAATLSEHSALAATILYRVLVDDILDRARSQAYGHGAQYLMRLAGLAQEATAEVSSHATYVEQLTKKHGRKFKFWSLISK